MYKKIWNEMKSQKIQALKNIGINKYMLYIYIYIYREFFFFVLSKLF